MQRTRGIRIDEGRLQCAEFLRSDFADREVCNSEGLTGWRMMLRYVREGLQTADDPQPTPQHFAGLECLEDEGYLPLEVAEDIECGFHSLGVHWIEEHGRNNGYGGEEDPKSYATWCQEASNACYEVAARIAEARKLVNEYDALVIDLVGSPRYEFAPAAQG